MSRRIHLKMSQMTKKMPLGMAQMMGTIESRRNRYILEGMPSSAGTIDSRMNLYILARISILSQMGRKAATVPVGSERKS
jgi:hypothetical protein